MSAETNEPLIVGVPETCADLADKLVRLLKASVQVSAKETILDADGSLTEGVCMLLMTAYSFVKYVDAYAPSTGELCLSKAKGALVQVLGKLLEREQEAGK